jgi:hypothetical protein
MRLVHTFSTKDHEPLSHGGGYLYDRYDRVASFLRRYGDRYSQVLAKPVLTGPDVHWYSPLAAIPSLSKLSELPEDIRKAVEERYWELKRELEPELDRLVSSANQNERSWGEQLKAVFDPAKNVILSNGEEWCLLWGWNFRNDQWKYRPPTFAASNTGTGAAPVPAPDHQEMDDAGGGTEYPEDGSGSGVAAGSNARPEETPYAAAEERLPAEYPGQPPRPPASSPTLKGVLRSMAGSYWGILLGIILLLYLICFVNRCTVEYAVNRCHELNGIEQELSRIEQRVHDNCGGSTP